MKFSRIIKYTLVMFLLLTTLSTFASMLIGGDNLGTLSFGEIVRYQLLPSSMLEIALYALMAKRSTDKAYGYAITVCFSGFVLSFAVLSLLMRQSYIPTMWLFEFPVSLISAVVGTFIGVDWRRMGLLSIQAPKNMGVCVKG